MILCFLSYINNHTPQSELDDFVNSFHNCYHNISNKKKIEPKVSDGTMIINEILQTGEIPSDINNLTGDKVIIQGSTMIKVLNLINNMPKDYVESQNQILLLQDMMHESEMDKVSVNTVVCVIC